MMVNPDAIMAVTEIPAASTTGRDTSSRSNPPGTPPGGTAK
jgi:hypothetical protein